MTDSFIPLVHIGNVCITLIILESFSSHLMENAQWWTRYSGQYRLIARKKVSVCPFLACRRASAPSRASGRIHRRADTPPGLLRVSWNLPVKHRAFLPFLPVWSSWYDLQYYYEAMPITNMLSYLVSTGLKRCLKWFSFRSSVSANVGSTRSHPVPPDLRTKTEPHYRAFFKILDVQPCSWHRNCLTNSKLSNAKLNAIFAYTI